VIYCPIGSVGFARDDRLGRNAFVGVTGQSGIDPRVRAGYAQARPAEMSFSLDEKFQSEIAIDGFSPRSIALARLEIRPGIAENRGQATARVMFVTDGHDDLA